MAALCRWLFPRIGSSLFRRSGSHLRSAVVCVRGCAKHRQTAQRSSRPSTSGNQDVGRSKKREVTLGSQGVGNRSYLYARLIAEILELKVRWVLGYDTLQLYVAIEQGEVQGRVNDAASMMTDRPE